MTAIARERAATPAKAVARFIAKFDAPIVRLARAARTRLRRRFPTAVELVYDNYNALAMGLSPNERTSEAFVSLAVFARGVNLYFVHGKKLPDPRGLLQGSGNQGRFVRLDAASRVDDADVVALLDAAVKYGRTPLPGRRGYTVIKSVSKKQRPRRTHGQS